MTSYIIPCLLAFVTLFALGQKIDVYNALVRGAENGLNVTFRIVPSLVFPCCGPPAHWTV